MKNLFLTNYVLVVFLLFYGCSEEKEKKEVEEIPVIHKITTFNNVRQAFGGEFSQSAEGTFSFPVDPLKVKSIKMYIRLRCPSGGCNAWDVFANIRVQDPETLSWLELGRYITPYGVDNTALPKGFVVDVTDFKSLLTGEVKLKSFIEVWGNDGWLVTVDFEVEEGTPDFEYYAVTPLLDYAQHSLAGVPYGEDHVFDLEKEISLSDNVEETTLRTTITGWGHATPLDNDGRPCAEWCFRSHSVLIDDVAAFTHHLQPLGCAGNPVQPQNGNWSPDRAGWCPGMAVPVRTNVLPAPRAGESFRFAYELQEWTNDFQTTAENKHAYYALSSYIIVKSHEPVLTAEVR